MFSRSQVIKEFIVVIAIAFLVVARPAVSHASTWKQFKPATSPTSRSYPAMAYDPVSKKIVLFGGFDGRVDLNDTWTFDGTTWIQVQTTVAPPARNATTMAYDKHAKKLVLFGGFNGVTQKFLQDTWVWDGATSKWSQVKMKTSPPGASGSMLFTDPHDGHAMIFGGFNATHSRHPQIHQDQIG